jgi:hypothetical protein
MEVRKYDSKVIILPVMEDELQQDFRRYRDSALK